MVKSTFKSHVIIDKSSVLADNQLLFIFLINLINSSIALNKLFVFYCLGYTILVQGIERGVYVVDKIQFNQVIEEFIKVNNLMTHIQNDQSE